MSTVRQNEYSIYSLRRRSRFMKQPMDRIFFIATDIDFALLYWPRTKILERDLENCVVPRTHVANLHRNANQVLPLVVASTLQISSAGASFSIEHQSFLGKNPSQILLRQDNGCLHCLASLIVTLSMVLPRGGLWNSYKSFV